MQLNRLPEPGAHILAELSRVDEKLGMIGADYRVGKENGVKGDIRATQVEQPRDFIQHRHHNRTRFLLFQLLTHILKLVRVAPASILDVERKHGVLQAGWSCRTPDQINKILAIRDIYRGKCLGIG
jgi:hypothetical protein